MKMTMTIEVPVEVSEETLALWVECMLNIPSTDGPWSAASEKQKRELEMLDKMAGHVDVFWDDFALRHGEVYERAVKFWGRSFQAMMLAEECGELVAAMSQHLRGRVPAAQVVEEAADVHVMLGQVPFILGGNTDGWRNKVSHIVAHKMRRLERLVQSQEPVE